MSTPFLSVNYKIVRRQPDCVDTDDNIGYGFALSQGATTGQENNADTYALYATASFLNTYDWNTGRAAAIGA